MITEVGVNSHFRCNRSFDNCRHSADIHIVGDRGHRAAADYHKYGGHGGRSLTASKPIRFIITQVIARLKAFM